MNGIPNSLSLSDIELIKTDSFVRTVEFYHELPSTNDLALERMMIEELETPLLVLAEFQTAGRGRGGNLWWSVPGALTFSLVIDRNECELMEASDGRLSLTTALAIFDALREYVPRCDIRLKWPNDVYLDSQKVAGILLERSSMSPARLVVGMGINVNNSLSAAPDEVRARATSLYDATGRNYPLCDVLRRILKWLVVRFRMLAADDPRLAVEWQQYSFLHDHIVRVTSGQRLIEGVCRGIDDQGALLVQTHAGLQRLLSGIVVHVE